MSDGHIYTIYRLNGLTDFQTKQFSSLYTLKFDLLINMCSNKKECNMVSYEKSCHPIYL